MFRSVTAMFRVTTKVEVLSSPDPNRRSKEMSRINEANFRAFCWPTSGLTGDELSASHPFLLIPVEISLISDGLDWLLNSLYVGVRESLRLSRIESQ